jgi:histone H3/H4
VSIGASIVAAAAAHASSSLVRPAQFRGKGGKGKGMGAKRHMTSAVDPLKGDSKGVYKKIIRKAGAKRVSGNFIEVIKKEAEHLLEHYVMCTLPYTLHARRQTVTASDVAYGLKRVGVNILGLDDKIKGSITKLAKQTDINMKMKK